MNRPNNLDPVAWATYNASQARNLASLSGLPSPEFAPLDEAQCGSLQILSGAVGAAVDALQAGGDAHRRIASRLLLAMARYEAEVHQ